MQEAKHLEEKRELEDRIRREVSDLNVGQARQKMFWAFDKLKMVRAICEMSAQYKAGNSDEAEEIVKGTMNNFIERSNNLM